MDPIILCALVVVVVIVVLFFVWGKNRCRFPSYDEFREKIAKSRFFSILTDDDLTYRQADTTEEYFLRYLNSYKEMTPCQKNRLKRLLNSMDLPDPLRVEARFVYLHHEKPIEFGFPHTHAGMIMLPKKCWDYTDEQLSETIVHELVHIWQNENVDEANEFAKRLGFHLTNSTAFLDTLPYSYVANPDVPIIDGKPLTFYFNYTPTSYSQFIPQTNQYIGKRFILKQIYRDYIGNMFIDSVGIDSTGESIVNVNFDGSLVQQGHPYEIMAELISLYGRGQKIRDDWRAILDDSPFA